MHIKDAKIDSELSLLAAVGKLNGDLFTVRAELAAAAAERARYGDMMTARLGQCENERDAAREELAIARKVMDKVADQRDAARAEAAELREQVARLRLHLGVLLDYTDEESYSNVPRREVNDAQDAWDETRPADNSSHVAP